MINNELKKQWGFHPLFESYYLAELEENANLIPARVVFAGRDHYEVIFIGETTGHLAKVRGQYFNNGWDLPAVGDWVLVELTPGDHEYLPVEKTLPRRTCLQRPVGHSLQVLLANTDYVGLVTSFNEDLNERRLERGLVMAEESGAKPFIVINKSDLLSAAESESLLSKLREKFLTVPVLACSATKNTGIEKITALFAPGDTVTFLGMSGVGKSSITNAILSQERMATSGIREDDSRGRHTTTARHLILAKNGFWMADTPGIREFSVFGEKENLDLNFDEISALSEKCKFKDCTHKTEPGCAVKEALENGQLDPGRWNSYLKMLKELEFHSGKHNKEKQSQLRKNGAKFSKNIRTYLQLKGRK